MSAQPSPATGRSETDINRVDIAEIAARLPRQDGIVRVPDGVDDEGRERLEEIQSPHTGAIDQSETKVASAHKAALLLLERIQEVGDYEQTLHAEIKALQTERDQLILGREASDKTTDNLRERLKLNTSTGEQYESQQKEDPETAQLRKENQQLKDRLAKYEASVMRLWMTDRERRALITKLYTENYQLEFDLEVALDRLRAFHALSQRFCAAIEGHIPAEDTQNNDDLYEDP